MYSGVRLYRVVLLCWFFVSSGHEEISNFCELVHERIFFTIRLTQTIEQLKKVTIHGSSSINLFDDRLYMFIKHPHVKNIVDILMAEQRLDPLLSFWDNDFVACKYLDDREYAADFIRLVLILVHNLVLSKELAYFKYPIFSDHESGYTSLTAYQFYFSQRLLEPVYFLFEQSHDFFAWMSEHGVSTYVPSYRSVIVKQIHHHIEQSNSLDEIFTAWRDMRNYRYIQDSDFPCDLTKLMFLLFYNYCTNKRVPLVPALQELCDHMHEDIACANPVVLCDLILQCMHYIQRSTGIMSPHDNGYLYNHYVPELTPQRSHSNDIVVHNDVFLTKFDQLQPIQQKSEINLSTWALITHKRYYFVLRLLLPLDRIKQAMQRENSHIKLMDNIFDNIQFEHSRLIHIAQEIQLKNDCTQYFELWDEIRNLTWIDDQRIIDEFTKMTFVLLKHFLTVQLPRSGTVLSLQQLNEFFYQSLMLPSDYILDVIDILCDAFVDMQISQKIDNFRIMKPAYRTDSMVRYPEAMALRYYIIKRLDRLFNYFELFNHHNIFTISIPAEIFIHDRIRHCIVAIEHTKSINPLLILWKEFNQYRSMDNADFCHEFIACAYIVACAINMFHKKDRDIVTHLMELSEKIDLMTLQEMLDAIDLIAEELPLLLEKYELNADMSWKAWAKKYWWTPPLILATIGIKLWMNHYKKNHPVITS